MSEHVPCEHCEEVRLEAEDKAFGEALREGLKMPKGTLGRQVADQYMKDLFAPPVWGMFEKGKKVKVVWGKNLLGDSDD